MPVTSWFRLTSSLCRVTVTLILLRPEFDSNSRTASSIFCCDVTPTDFKNLRIDRLKLSSLMASSCVNIRMACLKVTRWCQLIRKTIKLFVVSWIGSFLITPTTALALSLSHKRLFLSIWCNTFCRDSPRKTQVRFDRVETSGDIHFSAEEPEVGTAVFTLKSGTVIYIGTSTSLGEDLDYIALVDWLLSEPGRATIADFRQEGSQVAFPVEAVEAATVEVVIVGDLENGRELSTNHCRRCHKVDRATNTRV